VSKPYLFCLLGLAFERKADAPSDCKETKVKDAKEGLEGSRRLAKQVLSQLSYTPTTGTTSDSKVFAVARKLGKLSF
jgi:hypothetical protein